VVATADGTPEFLDLALLDAVRDGLDFDLEEQLDGSLISGLVASRAELEQHLVVLLGDHGGPFPKLIGAIRIVARRFSSISWRAHAVHLLELLDRSLRTRIFL